MNGYLLDSNVALVSLVSPEKISAAARAATELLGGRAQVDEGEAGCAAGLAATPLALWPGHVVRLVELGAFHSDPFDRILLAQALVEGFELGSSDGVFGGYAGLRVIW